MADDEPIDWSAALERALTEPDAVTPVVQPIVDLRRGTVVGYELLSRFAGPPALPPDHWFAAAETLGVSAALEARTLALGMDLLDRLPPNTFLTLNVEPPNLESPAVLEVLEGPDRLDRVVLELTERAVVEQPDELLERLGPLRERGALIAVDDAGAGYAGLALLLSLRPDIVKLDRGLISGLDGDPVKRVLVRALGELVASFDGWVLAEGIETTQELGELVALEVPLGQGYLLGRPQPTFAPDVPAPVLDAIHHTLGRTALHDLAIGLQRQVPLVRDRSASDAEPGSRVQVDDLDRPVAVEMPDGTWRDGPLLAKPSEPLAAVARRAVARSGERWAEPVVLTDGRGAAVGIVEVQRLLERLAVEPSTGS